jgi:AraC-like DNA-binding protein
MELLNVIILLGALQGFISSAQLLFGKTRTVSYRLLGVLILLISLACLNMYLLEIGLAMKSGLWSDISIVVPLVLAMLIGPLIYLYMKSLIIPGFVFKEKFRVHFYPAILDLVPRIIGGAFLIAREGNWLTKEEAISWFRTMDMVDMYLDIPRWISVSVYVLLAWQVYIAHSAKSDAVNKHWARKFLWSFSIFQSIWLLHLIPYVTPALSDELIRVVNWYPVYIPLAAMVYWLGINGFLLRSNLRGESPKPLSLSAAQIEETRAKLLQSMERDRLYLDPAFNLSLLVSHTGIPQKIISSVLNQQIGKSFNEFVNGYRIEAVKQRLGDDQNHLTITGIAFECGFNSQATFQRAFKSLTGKTPTEYLTDSKTRSNSSQI